MDMGVVQVWYSPTVGFVSVPADKVKWIDPAPTQVERAVNLLVNAYYEIIPDAARFEALRKRQMHHDNLVVNTAGFATANHVANIKHFENILLTEMFCSIIDYNDWLEREPKQVFTRRFEVPLDGVLFIDKVRERFIFEMSQRGYKVEVVRRPYKGKKQPTKAEYEIVWALK